MLPSSRRRFLRSMTSSAGLVAGCVSVAPPSPSGGSESPVSRLSADASVVHRTTDSSPPVIELGLTNDGSESVPVVAGEEGGHPMEYLPAGDLGLFVFPVEPEHVFVYGPDLPTAPSDGCWRVPEDVAVAVENLGFHVTLAPGERYAIRHRLYDAGSGEGCYPSETVHLTASLELAEQMGAGPAFDLVYRLSFDESGELSIAVDEPVER